MAVVATLAFGTLAASANAQRPRRNSIVDLAWVGDLDLDGSEDVVVHATSEAYAVSGRTGHRLFAVQGATAWSTREWEQQSTIAALGDVDGDGRPDFALAWMPYTDRGTPIVRVHSGRDGDVLAEFVLDIVGARPAVTVAAAGDLDGDGRCDLLLGMPWWDRERGRVRALSSARWSELWSADGIAEYGLFGSASASLGDQAGDGASELAVAAPSSSDPAGRHQLRRATSSIAILSGSTGSVVRRIESGALGLPERLGWLGRPLVACADLDGDSKRDLVAGWSSENWSSETEPRVLAISSSTGARIATYRGVEETFDMFGQSLASIGDVDGDGADDLIVGDPEANVSFDLESPNIVDSGRVKLCSGRDGRLLRTWRGQDFYGCFGTFVCRAGDLNGDRVPDVWIAELSPARLHSFSGKDGSYLRRIDLATFESPAALGPLGR